MISLRYRRKIYDLGSGLNIFSKQLITQIHFKSLPNDLTFNVELLKRIIGLNIPFNWFPISWTYENQRSNVKVISLSLKTFKLIVGGSTQESFPIVEPIILGEF